MLAGYSLFAGYMLDVEPRHIPTCFRLRKLANPALRDGSTIKIKLRGMRQYLHLRVGTSDPLVFEHIFGARHYGFPIAAPVRTCIDAGVNIGLSAVFFLRKYPGLRLVAIEPDAENHALALKNLSEFEDRCCVIHGALWTNSEALQVHNGFGDGREWGMAVRPVGVLDSSIVSTTVNGCTLKELMNSLGVDQVDICKIDIEGSECELIAKNPGFFSVARACAIEIHDANAAAVFREKARELGYQCSMHGDVTLALR